MGTKVKVMITFKGKEWTQVRTSKAWRACELIEKVVNSEEFKERVLTAKMVNTNGMSNKEIYNCIMKADEIHYHGADDINVMNIVYHLIKRPWWMRVFSAVMGFGYANTLDTYTYLDVFDRLDIQSLAGHLFHEWVHELGFADSARAKKSVTYVLGYLVEELARKI